MNKCMREFRSGKNMSSGKKGNEISEETQTKLLSLRNKYMEFYNIRNSMTSDRT